MKEKESSLVGIYLAAVFSKLRGWVAQALGRSEKKRSPRPFWLLPRSRTPKRARDGGLICRARNSANLRVRMRKIQYLAARGD